MYVCIYRLGPRTRSSRASRINLNQVTVIPCFKAIGYRARGPVTRSHFYVAFIIMCLHQVKVPSGRAQFYQIGRPRFKSWQRGSILVEESFCRQVVALSKAFTGAFIQLKSENAQLTLISISRLSLILLSGKNPIISKNAATDTITQLCSSTCLALLLQEQNCTEHVNDLFQPN